MPDRVDPLGSATARRPFLTALASASLGITLPLTLRSSPGSAQAELPPATRTVLVASPAQLASALANARPGDHIVLADGIYNGAFSASVAATATAPIVIKASNKLRATIAGSFDVSGSNTILWGLNFSPGGTVNSLRGPSCRVLRCRFDGGAQTNDGATVLVIGTDCEIAYCEFLKHRTRAIDVAVGRGARRTLIRRNWFHDVIETTRSDVYNAAIRVGIGEPSGMGTTQAQCVIEYNLLERYHAHFSEAVSLKTSGNVVRLNTLLHSKSSTFMCRLGTNNTLAGNWVENNTPDTGGIYVMQNDHVLLGNYVVAPCLIRIFAGNRTPYERPDAYSPAAQYPAAWNTILAGNNGRLLVGSYYGSVTPPMTVRAKNTVIEAHTGTVSYDRQENTRLVTSTSRTIPRAIKLSPSDVGPNAT